MTEPVVRDATSEDEEAIVALMRSYYADDGYPFHEASARRALARLVREPALGRVWVIDTGGAIVGYVAMTLGFSLEYLGRDAFVDELYVAPEWRGRGLGRRALGRVEDACRDLDVNALHLEVERSKSDAARLYERSGFVENDRSLMTKRLAAVTPDEIDEIDES